MLVVSDRIQIPPSEFEISYVRSSGPGGQNVNKVNSKAVLRWNVLSSPSLTEELRARIIEKLANQLTRDFDILISSDRYRDQGRNREDCFEKLKVMVAAAAEKPKFRRETRPTRGSKRRAEVSKGHQSDKKKQRRSTGWQD